MKTRNLYFGLATVVLILTACEGENPFGETSGIEKEITNKYLEAEASVSNVYNILDKALRDTGFQANDSAEIDEAIVVRSGNTITIDYGNGAISADGRTRKGAILITESGDYFNHGGNLGITFQNYFVDGKSIQGVLDIYNNGSDSLLLDINEFSAGSEFVFNASKVIAWNSGFNTLSDPSDDSYYLSGMASGSDLSNNELTTEIITPLFYNRNCEFGLVSGEVDLSITADSAETATAGALDFITNDGCDNLVKVTVEQGGVSLTSTQQFSGF